MALSGLLLAGPSWAARPLATVLYQRNAGANDEAQDRFGSALAMGDFDGDGYDDLAIGGPYEDVGDPTNNGYVAVHYGGPRGPGSRGSTWFSQADFAGAADESHDRFGSSLEAFDFDGDGYDDLAVGGPYEDAGSVRDVGMVAVVYGSPGGLDTSVVEVITQSSFSNAANDPGDLFGFALGAGDFDGDGFGDLAIAAPYEDTHGRTATGMVAVLYGSFRGLLPARHEVITQTQLASVANEALDRFGYALSAGDFDGDGHDDLAVGVPYEHVGGVADAGVVVIVPGSGNGLLPARDTYFDKPRLHRLLKNQTSDRFGFALAAGNLDDDPWDDLVIGAPYELGGAGMVVVAYGSPFGLRRGAARVVFQNAFEVSERDDRLGHALAVADFDGDGFDDLAAGTPLEDAAGRINNGSVVVIFGNEDRRIDGRRYSLRQEELGTNEEDDDLLGFVLAAGDSDGDGVAELVFGVPGEDVGDRSNAGVVLVSALEPALPKLESGQAAIVVNTKTGTTVGALYPDQRRAMGSTTKMMTALLALEEVERGALDLDDLVTVGANAVAATVDGGTTMGSGLAVGDRVSVEDLLYGLLLPSGNDAAVALAERIAGTEARFVDRMNERAVQLGLPNTHFGNAHGRDPQKIRSDVCDDELDYDDPDLDFEEPSCAHYSTARDLARLARFALGYPTFATIVGTASRTTSTWRAADGSDRDQTLRNTNRLIRLGSTTFYPAAYGVKTGTTARAGRCLVSAARDFRHDVVAVLLGAADDDNRYADSVTLLDYGLALVPPRTPPATD